MQRTVEMFEAITQAQPNDYQSLEILKDAYGQLGRKENALQTSLKLVNAYEKQGQLFKAILECEGILQEHPDQAQVRQRLAQLESQARQAVGETATVAAELGVARAEPFESVVAQPAAVVAPQQHAEEGDRALAEVLISEKLATPQALAPLLQQLKTMRASPHPDRGGPLSLVQLIVNEQFAKLEDVLTVLVNKSMLPYLPLANYDVDRETVCLLPLELCWQFCVVPFDQIGRCVLVATANPFQTAAKRAVETTLQTNVFWYVSAPMDIASVLKRAHRIGAGTKPGATS